MRDILARAMRQSDDLVVEIDYMDSQGHHTRRVISPIRFTSRDHVLALCLCREEPRNFNVNRFRNPQLRWAADVVMPVQFAEPKQPVGQRAREASKN